jgi:hypothetical protein
MIGEVVRGNSMPDLISYLFGPGKHNEHVNQHLVAGFADAVFTADDRLWKDEPGIQRRVHAEARSLGWQVEFPHSRWGTEIGDGYVWHCSVSISQDEGGLTDAQWSEAAHEIIRALGFDGADGKAPCRWVAVRHGLSGNGNDHIHIAVNLVREDGTRASTWNDYRKVGRACSALEDRFGLRNVPGRITGRHLPEPSRADTEISARTGEPEPLRIGLERKVRACAAVATSEDHFTRLAAERGLLVRPRLGADGTSIGYAFADATARRTTTGSPLWFGGGKLASDLTARKIQQRWQTPADPVTQAADATAIAAVAAEPGSPGSLAHAERHMARAAQAGTVLAGMAATFLAVTRAGTASPQSSALILAEEASALIDACIAAATTTAARRDITNASTLVHTTVADLASRAEAQARHALTQGETMTDLTHEDEFLTHLTQAGVLSARLTQALLTGGKGTGGVTAKQIAALKAAGYTETTPYDQDLRRLLGEPRWASYLADPARIVAAAAITDAAAAGRDMPKLLERAVNRRRWEDDERSPSRSVAKILAYRVTSEMRRQATTRRSIADRPHDANQDHITTNGSVPQPPVPAQREKPPAPTPYDGTLRDLLGERRWQQYAGDGRRAAVADLLIEAGAEGRDMKALITHVVEFRKFEDDETSPSRRVAGVLHYRLKSALASGKFPPRDPDALADRSKAPATSTQPSPFRTGQVPPHRAAPRTDEREGR